MAYTKTEWKARQGSGLNKFTKSQETDTSVVLTNTPEDITEPGTSFTAERMNRIEEGIGGAHEAVEAEAEARAAADENLAGIITEGIAGAHEAIESTNSILADVRSIQLAGALLTRTIGGLTEIQKSLFDSGTVFTAGKTLIFDGNGTEGVYTGDAGGTAIVVLTKSLSPVSSAEPTLLGRVNSNADLPLTISGAESLSGKSPRVGDYATVLTDETMDDRRVEWYVTGIAGENITWGNPIFLNTGDYQEQTGSADAGKVLTGGATAGTFGESKSIATEVTGGSESLVTSGAVFSEMAELREAIEEAREGGNRRVPLFVLAPAC